MFACVLKKSAGYIRNSPWEELCVRGAGVGGAPLLYFLILLRCKNVYAMSM